MYWQIKKTPFLQELTDHHVSGQLRVAPEHVSEKVLQKMGKPSHQVYEEFLKKYQSCCKRSGKEQYAVPYFMSSHPGCGLKEAVELAEYIRDMGFMPEQVQDFYPNPSTISTCMYYTGVDPLTMEKVYIPRNPHEKSDAEGAHPIPESGEPQFGGGSLKKKRGGRILSVMDRNVFCARSGEMEASDGKRKRGDSKG